MLTLTPAAILDGTENTATLTWNFNSGSEAFDYLATGETLVLTYTVTATDDDGAPLADIETVTITITGTNDTPVITDGPDTASLSETNAGLTATGTLIVTDVDTTDTVAATTALVVTGTSDRNDAAAPDDADLHAMFSVAPTAILDGTENKATLTWNFNSGSEAFNYLATGETLVLTYTVTATDDDSNPLSDSETVTITITGTNDAPVITDGPDTADLDETDAGLSASGTLTVTDVDTSDTVAASTTLAVSGTSDRTDAAAPSDATLLGMLTVTPAAILDGTENTATLTWNFNSGSEAFDYLATGETLVLTYTVTATDDDGTPLSDRRRLS
jgi:VCBS repeat